jgi:Flp pilus assembly protein TadG
MHMQSFNRSDAPACGSVHRRRKRQSGSVLMMFTLLMPVLLIPMVGLGIDGTMMYSVKVKLQTAVDGAALAAAQSLNSGLSLAAQTSAASLAADEFIRANIITGASAGNSGYWGAYNLNDSNCQGSTSTLAGTPTGTGSAISYGTSGNCVIIHQDDQNAQRTVSIAASVNVPLLFMRILGFTGATVTSRSTAARRDVVMVLVLDQSSSMVPAMSALKAAATYFVSQFQPGRDRLGLVVLGGSAITAYPSGDWGKDPLSGGLSGPDVNWANTPDSAASPNIYTSITALVARSNTGTAEALMYGYDELVAANQPGALNVLVLFTDGQPNGISAYFNPQVNSSMQGGTTCTYAPNDGGNSAHSIIGWMAQWGGFKSGTSSPQGFGIGQREQTDKTSHTTVGAWLSDTGSDPLVANGSGQPGHGCNFVSSTYNDYKDIKFTTKDLYGNYLNGPSAVGAANYTANDYQLSFIWTASSQGCLDTSNGARQTWNLTHSVADACQVGLASWNAADMAAYQIHQDTTIKPHIYCLGYEGNGGDDPAFMTRLANIQTNPGNGAANAVYDATKPQGLYIQVQTQADIMPAFQSILAEILRISL